MRNKSVLLALSSALALSAAPAFATDITVQDFIGKIVIETGEPSLRIERDHNQLEATSDDNAMRIDGGFTKPGDEDVCNYTGRFKFNWSTGDSESWDRRLKDYPDLRISVPNGSRLKIENSYVRLINKADLDEANLELYGCLPVSMGNVGTLEMKKRGSGDLDARTIGELTLDKTGSGDIEIEDLGYAKMSVSGSGDVEIDSVNGELDMKKSGAGDIEIDRIDGILSISKRGAGDIDVGSGSIPRLYLKKSGAGDADIDADIDDAEVISSGAGDTYLRRVDGELTSRTSGAGDLDVGNR